MLLVPLDDNVVFPNMDVTIPADVGEEARVLLVPRHDGEYAKVGTVAEVAERVRLPGGIGAVTLVGLHRGVAGAAHTDAQGRLRVEVQERPDEEPPGVKTRELEREYRAVVEEILELRGDDGRISAFVRSIREVGTLADTAAYAPEVSFEQRIELLERVNVVERLELALQLQRERLAELQIRHRIREVVRLERMGDQSGESSMIRTYLDWLLAVPWGERSEERLDPVHAREVLDADHAGLEDVKERIVEYLAVRKLRQERGIAEDKRSGAILTLIGPPDTGKTSVGESIACALNREFVRMSLGGVRDEAEIRGRRRTYIGALPGRLVDAGVARRAVGADRGDAVGLGDPAREGVRPPPRRRRTLPGREPTARAAAGAPADGRPRLLRAHPVVLRHHPGAGLPRRRPIEPERGHDRRVHDPADAAAVPDREHAPDLRRGTVVAGALRAFYYLDLRSEERRVG